ncbi:MAG: hypothetical protein ABIO57_03450 [Candidatus Paceibacterota bacterium]
MRKPFAMLYENKVFSIAPNLYGYKSVLDDTFVEKQGDLYFINDPMYGEIPFPIYQYDAVETYLREQRIVLRKTNIFDLAVAKKLIVDDRLPAFKEFWLDEEDQEEDSMGMNTFYLEGDRHSLISFIKDCRYSDAVPELREVALYDESHNLRRHATSALQAMRKNIADPVVNEILGCEHDRYRIIDIAFSLQAFSSGEIYCKNLRKKFEQYYHDFTDNYLSIKYYKTVPQAIMLACGHIPSTEAVEILEEGIKHPFAHVEKNARTSLSIWVDTVVRSGKNDPTLIKKAFEIEKKYDTRVMYGKGWDTFQKKPGAEFRF